MKLLSNVIPFVEGGRTPADELLAASVVTTEGLGVLLPVETMEDYGPDRESGAERKRVRR